ncbi:MAG: hypothetical protein IJ518_07605 [Clostridia bacterium]|nr:hypothetical protein [Clostridia bacterium]
MFWRRNKPKKVNETALRVDGKELTLIARRYMDENGNPQEEGLGRGGRIDTANGHVILSNGEREVFVNGDISTVECAELMSKNGAIFTGFNELTGQEDTIVAYYSKWRQ